MHGIIWRGGGSSLKLDVQGQRGERISDVDGQGGWGVLKIGHFLWTSYVYHPLAVFGIVDDSRDEQVTVISLRNYKSLSFHLHSKAYSEPCQRSKMELFAVNYFRKTLHLRSFTGF